MEGRVLIPRFGIDAKVSFLVDTGADTSLIAPADAKQMAIDYSRLAAPVESLGIGGKALSHPVEGSLVFTDPGRFHYLYHLASIDVAVPDPEIDEMPSLLGRDVLDRWRMAYDPVKNELSFLVRSWDSVLPIPR